MKRFADIVIRYRALIIIILAIITVLFAVQMRKLNVQTSFADLLPQTHPYIKIHNEMSQTFGGANFLLMMLEVKNGDIFNQQTLAKIKYVTEELEKIPGVDRYKILSIAHQKLKNFQYTSWGTSSTPLMWPKLPKNDQEMKALREAIYASTSYYGYFVSNDCKRSLITADFFEDALDYNIVYKELNRIRAAVEDDNNVLSIVGYPMHIGVIHHMVEKINYLLIGTGLLIPVLLFLAYRSLWATFIVPSAGIISAIWGLGFMGFLGYNLDPMVLVMPFLISLMAFRHSHQLYNRFYEEYIRHGDKIRGAHTVIEEMFLPGLVSVVTDAFGIAIVAIVPIPMLRNISIACAFWSIITVLIGLILTPLLLTYSPVSHKFLRTIEKKRQREHDRTGWENRFADWLGPWIITLRGKYSILGITLFIICFSWFWSNRLIVGDVQVGSNFLYPSSRYNQDSVRINTTHPIINPLYIIVAGKEKNAIKNVKIFEDVYNFTSYMKEQSGALFGQNLIQNLMAMTQGMHGNDPKWFGFPDTEKEALVTFTLLASTGDPGDMDRYIDYHDQYTNITMYYKDKTGPTIQQALDTAKDFIRNKSRMDPGTAQYKLAGGVIGVEAAINEVVAEKQLQTLLLALLGVFLFCSLEFFSIKCGLILMLPLCVSNYMAFAYMAINQIGLTIATLPVSAAGIGMGVDYGIYLLARIAEEQKNDPSRSLEQALVITIKSYGKSIIYIAGTLVAGLLVWVLSPLKFQAQMGMMLAVILFLNCLGAIFLVPVLVLLFKPKFSSGKTNNAPYANSEIKAA
ncbi:MAG: MMPL family transporter [Proteobacteria bacterium]|nr:MMPL family transporter [Pseudomonadota bacterium]